jgi:hypothetical protein
MQSAAELAALDVMRADRIDGSSEVRGGNYERLDVHSSVAEIHVACWPITTFRGDTSIWSLTELSGR